MSTVKRFIKNTVILVIAKAIQPVITFYLIVVISRKIGVEGFGAYSTIFKYLMIFQIIAAFGLRNLLARDIAQNKQKSHEYIVAGTYLAVLFSVISIIAMNIFVWVLSNDPLVKYGALITSFSLIATAVTEVYEGVVTGHELIKQIGYALLGENLIRVALSLALIYNGYGIIAVVWVFVFARFLYAWYFNFYINKYVAGAFGKLDKLFALALFKQARTFALIMICVTIYWNVDGIMIESIRSVAEAGYYSAAFRFLFLAMIFVQSYITSLFPVISNYYETSRTNFEIACKKSLRILILATVPLAIALSFKAESIIVMLFGDKYVESIKALQLLIWVLIPYAVSQVFAYALIASKNQNADLKVNAISMLANIILNFILIPKMGFMGAAIAILISINIYISMQIPFVVPKLLKFDFKDLVSKTIRVLFASGLMAVFLYSFNGLNLFVAVPIGFGLYLLSLIILKVFSESDWELLFRIVRKAI